MMEMKKEQKMQSLLSKSKMMVQMSAPKESDTAVFSIYDDIGEDGCGDGVGPKSISDFLASHPDVSQVEIHINSLGGSLYDGIAIYNLLKMSGKKVISHIDGIAASAASVIAMAGEVRMPKTSTLMIHNAWTVAAGNAKQLRAVADELDKVMGSVRQAYLKKAGDKLEEDELIRLLDAESYLSADEALACGLCDVIPDEEEKPETDRKDEPEDTGVENALNSVLPSAKSGWFFHG